MIYDNGVKFMPNNNDMADIMNQALSNGLNKSQSSQNDIKNKLKDYMNTMSDEQKKQVQGILSDENKLKALLSSQKAQQLLKQLQK